MLRNRKLYGLVSEFDNRGVPRSKGPAIGDANTMNYFVHKEFSMTKKRLTCWRGESKGRSLGRP